MSKYPPVIKGLPSLESFQRVYEKEKTKMVEPSPPEREKMPRMWEENKDGKILLLA